MRAALQSAIRLFLSIPLLASVAGCATTSGPRVEEPGDLSRYRTWDWLRGPGETPGAAADPSSELERRVARRIAEAMGARGFLRAPGRAELLVDFDFELRREVVQIARTGAVQTLNSLHSSPSFEVQATTYETHRYQVADLRIVAIDLRERSVVWRGALAQRYEPSRSPPVGDAVARLLERMPTARPQRDGARAVARERAADGKPPS